MNLVEKLSKTGAVTIYYLRNSSVFIAYMLSFKDTIFLRQKQKKVITISNVFILINKLFQ